MEGIQVLLHQKTSSDIRFMCMTVGHIPVEPQFAHQFHISFERSIYSNCDDFAPTSQGLCKFPTDFVRVMYIRNRSKKFHFVAEMEVSFGIHHYYYPEKSNPRLSKFNHIVHVSRAFQTTILDTISTFAGTIKLLYFKMLAHYRLTYFYNVVNIVIENVLQDT